MVNSCFRKHHPWSLTVLFKSEDMDIDTAVTFIAEREDDRLSDMIDAAREEEPPPAAPTIPPQKVQLKNHIRDGLTDPNSKLSDLHNQAREVPLPPAI